MPFADFMLDDMLARVRKPARYTGGELNEVKKNLGDVSVRFAFAFPDVYEVGMSHLGMRILYRIVNDRPDFYMERVFAPWPDMAAEMKEHGVPLFTLETRTPLREMDFVGFTLQYELSYTNIVHMLELAGIPLHSPERGEDMPLIIAGGPCAFNPEPLAPFLDAVVLGDGEEVTLEIMDEYKRLKAEGRSRHEIIEALSKIEGVYVPSMRSALDAPVKKRVVRDLDAAKFPETAVVPYIEAVHDRITLELFRGCSRGCRFCQAGFIYRPVRERSVDSLCDTADTLLKTTGYDEISLSSLSSGDYSGLTPLISRLMNAHAAEHVSLSLPSLRIDSFAGEWAKELARVRKSGLTFAPEAGSQRLRDVINKNVTEDDLLSSVSSAFAEGFTSVKLYFMIGLPTETFEDLDAIADLVKKVVYAYNCTPREKRGKGLRVSVSASNFVPKAFTPFQWCAQDSVDLLHEKQQHLKRILKMRHVDFSWHDARASRLEAVFARGDAALAPVIAEAARLGCGFDGWSEMFRIDLWEKAFSNMGISQDAYTGSLAADALLPWDHLSCLVNKDYLLEEYNDAIAGRATPDCRDGCRACGLEALCL